jgi:hypothetical protein
MSFNPDVGLKYATEQIETGNELCFIEIVGQRPLGRKAVRNAGFILRSAKGSIDATASYLYGRF